MRLPAAILFPVALALSMAPHGQASDMHKGHGAPTHTAGMAKPGSCDLAVRVTEAAERQAGGAHHKGMPASHHAVPGKDMVHMKGAHTIHEPQHGGAFFMAPNKMHHLEGMYSEACGFQLVFYNAFTKSIRADRFRAMIKVVPTKDDEPEVMRFLSKTQHDTVLHATVGNEVSRPFTIELYIEFPDSDEPQLFTIKVPAKSS